MSNTALATPDEFNKQLAELGQIQKTCRDLMQTPHYKALGEVGIHTIIARAKALGIHPFEALNGGFYIVHGRVGMSTEMMAALVRKKGHHVTRDPKCTPESIILNGKRADNGDTWTCKFDKDDAIAAGLWGTSTWKKYPTVMLYNRCMSMLFRQLFPDLSLGAGYTKDELNEIAKTGDYNDPIDIPVQAMPEMKQIEDKHEEKPKYQVITMDQIIELSNYLGECEQKFRDKIHKFVSEATNGKYNTLEYFPSHLYEQTLEAAKKNMEEQHAKQLAEVVHE